MPFAPSQDFKMYGDHPILGRSLGPPNDAHCPCQIYTRTVVLWAVNMTIDTESLWRFVTIIGADNREVWHIQPVPTTATHGLDGHMRHGPVRCAATVPDGMAAMRHPIIRTICTSTHRRGVIPKRMFSVPFRNQCWIDMACFFTPPRYHPNTVRSVLSMDIEYRGAMPNLKISYRNTIQATGCQNQCGG